jgi:predicted signal transduction protein with EAL and GGDEF domain
LLREVAKRLHKTVREHDTVARGTESGGAHGRHSVARLGGDEFTILLTDLSEPQAAERIAQRLLDALRQPFACAGNELFVTASIGVAVYPRDGADVDTLLRKADIAMYAVKDNGRNGWCEFDDKMNTATADRWRTESALHRALERNELVLHYQPKVNVVEGKIVGAEALMRWKRNGELVPPSEFIAVAEESGLIVPITEWAIAEVARQLTTWRDAGIKPVPVSVNISSRHVQRADVAAPVKAALASSGLPPKLFELELTETVLMQNLAAGVPLLQSLKQLGVTISIDDFGTGYSSLAYLKRLPLDVLKIDRSFVRELEISSDSAAIVAAIIAMSKSLKLRVVAEGVETRGQMSRLYQQGCQVMQGFLFARPVPADEFCVLLKGERTNPEWSVASALPARAHAPGSAAPAAPAAARAGSVHAGTPPAVGVATATTPAGGQRSARLRAAHTLARSRN